MSNLKVVINQDEVKCLLAEYAIRKLGLPGGFSDYSGEVEMVIDDVEDTVEFRVEILDTKVAQTN